MLLHRVLENTSTYATGAVYFRVLLSTTDTSYDSTLNNIMNDWPRVLSIKDNEAIGFTVIDDDPNSREITQAADTGLASQTENYPLSQQYDRTLTTTSSTVGSFSIPAPESSISKRQGIDISVLFEITKL